MFEFILTLTSDAEPGTGLGTELVNDRFPRDTQGRPTLPGSHIKGLLRHQWQRIAPFITLPDADMQMVTDSIFGCTYRNDVHQLAAQATVLRLPDLEWQSGPDHEGSLAARTAINEPGSDLAGTALAHSLRVTETIPTGTRFKGTLHWTGRDARIEPILRLCLLSLEAVGGSRQRGCGRCVIEITNDHKSPASDARNHNIMSQQHADQINDALAAIKSATSSQQQESADPTRVLPKPDGPCTWWRLDFTAHEPVLCPEHPEAANHIAGGACIPASAVIGAIISGLGTQFGHEAAQALLNSPSFRAGPLRPSGFADTPDSQGLAMAVPLSLTVAKDMDAAQKAQKNLAADSLLNPAQRDAIESPKSLSGSLIQNKDGLFYLKLSDLPHLVRAQVGLDESTRGNTVLGPQLFSIDAVGPCCWSGVICLPQDWSDCVNQILQQIAFGRRRTAMGGGTGTISPYVPPKLQPGPFALVAQAPLLVGRYTNLAGTSHIPDPAATMRTLVKTWIDDHHLPLQMTSVASSRGATDVGYRGERCCAAG